MAVVPAGLSLVLPSTNRVIEAVQNFGEYLQGLGEGTDGGGVFLGRTASEAAAAWGAGMLTGAPIAPPLLATAAVVRNALEYSGRQGVYANYSRYNGTNGTNSSVPLLTYNATPALNFTSIPAAPILDPGFGRPGTTFRYDGRGRGRSVFYRRPPSGSHRGTFGWRQFPDRDSALRWMYRARSRVWRGRHGVIRRHRGPRSKTVGLFGGGYGPRRFHGSRGVSGRRVFKVRNGAVTRFIRR